MNKHIEKAATALCALKGASDANTQIHGHQDTWKYKVTFTNNLWDITSSAKQVWNEDFLL